MVRFLHTADWQIGRQYGQFDPEDAAMLAEARLAAVEAIAAQAAQERVDAVLVAGDVFDMQEVSDRTVRRLFGALSAYAGPWVMIAGNHDAALSASVWTRAQQLGCVPHNVHLPAATGVVDLPDAGLAVLAAPLTQRHTYDDVTAAFDALASEPGRVRVGLAHGSVSGHLPDTIDSANPIAADRAARAQLDYLALGDWHGCLQIDARTWYAGTPEPDRFRANAPGQMLLVQIDGPGATPDVTPRAVGRYRWHAVEARIHLPGDADALVHQLAGLGADDVVQLKLSGEVNGGTHAQVMTAVGETQGRVRALRLDARALELVPDDSDVAAFGSSGYLADVAAELRARQDDPAQATAAREALRLLVGFAREGA
ncbi:DNA repair exonuclease [Achromobacter sp. GG226]|uniref:metallophosphoesterase family protein n=1 Tax=Verticiella alkaliphila TaxID=2779529 RepID=UPI001C0C3D2E|nr:DNA repair exonuclease [Verticiella sp. GG226]MBU4610065.1 DNA repair exonuclease [Verticiella sp. GG226]